MSGEGNRDVKVGKEFTWAPAARNSAYFGNCRRYYYNLRIGDWWTAMVNVNPEILVWARKHAGLEREDIAHRIFSDSKNATAIEKLRRVEEEPDDFKPTRAQLTSMSAAYMQPLLVFYLATPPQRGDRGVDFRTLPQQSSYPVKTLSWTF